MLGVSESIINNPADFSEIADKTMQAVKLLRTTGMSSQDIVKVLCCTEPFLDYKEVIGYLVENMDESCDL